MRVFISILQYLIRNFLNPSLCEKVIVCGLYVNKAYTRKFTLQIHSLYTILSGFLGEFFDTVMCLIYVYTCMYVYMYVHVYRCT